MRNTTAAGHVPVIPSAAVRDDPDRGVPVVEPSPTAGEGGTPMRAPMTTLTTTIGMPITTNGSPISW
jgi:hypothetical protein